MIDQNRENQLILEVKNGKEASFSELVESYQSVVFNTALGMLQNNEDAEDIAQEVFMEVYESIEGFKGNAKLSTWIYRITVSKCLEHIRAKKTKKRFGFLVSIFSKSDERTEAMDIPDFNHPGVILENKQRAAVLFKAIEQLPDAQKTAFTLHKLQGLSYENIAEVMNVSLASTESTIHRAKTNLKKSLKTYYENEG